jgi:hypothetical protein
MTGIVVTLMEDEGKDGPARMVCDGAALPEAEDSLGKLQQAKTLIEDCLSRWPDRTAETVMIEEEVQSKGIGKRTIERALRELKAQGRVDQPQRGSYRLVPPPPQEAA